VRPVGVVVVDIVGDEALDLLWYQMMRAGQTFGCLEEFSSD
jgi:hypothetical protein